MYKKGVFLIIIGICVICGVTPFVRANFVCGEVQSETISPAWLTVMVYYTENSSRFTTCAVSPNQNRYCCDPTKIAGTPWTIGRSISARILTHEYAAEPVTTVTSGEGFTVFPPLVVSKTIDIHSPNVSLIIGNRSVLINVSTAAGFRNSSYLLNHTSTGSIVLDAAVCANCTQFERFIDNLSYGSYELSVTASNNRSEVVSARTRFTLVESFSIDRVLLCERCKGFLVFSGQNVTVQLTVRASEPVEGTLTEYVPNDWEVISGGEPRVYSSTHDQLSWAISGSTQTVAYTVMAPRVVFAWAYLLQSMFESYTDSVDRVIVYRFYRFISFPLRYLTQTNSVIDSNSFLEISSINPAVLNRPHDRIVFVAVFPNQSYPNVHVFLHDRVRTKLHNAYNFGIATTIPLLNIQTTLIRFKVAQNVSYFSVNDSLYAYNTTARRWVPLPAIQTGEDEQFSYFESYASNQQSFALRRYS